MFLTNCLFFNFKVPEDDVVAVVGDNMGQAEPNTSQCSRASNTIDIGDDD